MDSKELRKILEAKLKGKNRIFSYDQKQDKLRIENSKSKKGITLSLPGILNRYETEKEKAIDEIVYYVEEAMNVMNESQTLSGKEKKIFPVIRSTSFPTETKDGKQLLYKDHTAETRIFFAVDLELSYRLIDKEFMEKENVDEQTIQEMASFNLRSLPNKMKKDVVAGNAFYFINYNDGYDASRILNQQLLDHMKEKAEGQLTVAVPHQDVLIFGDIVNDKGYDVLGQMAMHFFTNGNIPITSLPFMYGDKGLEPIFILAKNKPIDED
ncbi:uncharacterized protein YtpQ (UPF0354 family) [Scopulibacillus daqui]|uniref:Uncharacterized protein YtpQ (UPF0354 family) n=1 Tax=Scopulibacillus daqui TaxID=1469162 RepID=A0ABS2PZ74_9BACL|nr:DUF1444 domain-containing protein [Scopulibacillus daqui]MBM7644865.1 uncharacterized protein YtpQ (UPF0354 family) [Scopulibacillus daqui]